MLQTSSLHSRARTRAESQGILLLHRPSGNGKPFTNLGVFSTSTISLQLFLDDSKMKNFTSCFKEKKFLRFFFNQLRFNNTSRYPEFPYLSVCGKERNFVRCDDYPIVFTHVVKRDEENFLSHNHAGDMLLYKFEPGRIFMLPDTGRVYHPAADKAGSIGLVRSKLAIQFSKYFTFENGESNQPTHFMFEDKLYELDQEWYNEKVEIIRRLK